MSLHGGLAEQNADPAIRFSSGPCSLFVDDSPFVQELLTYGAIAISYLP